MTTIKGRTSFGTESNRVGIGLPRGFYFHRPRRVRRDPPDPYELPVAVSLDPGRWPPRPIAPHREESCL